MEFAEWEVDRFIGFEVVQGESAEIGYEDVLGHFLATIVINQPPNVRHRLRFGFAQVPAARFVLGDQCSRPEEINKLKVSGEVANRFLETCDGASADAEDVEKLVPEGLRFCAFAACLRPFMGKGDGVLSYLIPAQRHGSSLSRS